MADIEITDAWLDEFAARRRNVDEDPTWIAIRLSERDALVAALRSERTRLAEVLETINVTHIGRWACEAVSEIGFTCNLQPDHGGNMHSGGNPRKWWTRDGKMVDFAATELERERAQNRELRAENALRGLDRILDPDGVSAASRLSTQEESK